MSASDRVADEGGGDEAPSSLVAWLREAFDDDALRVEGYRKLSGGAIQQNLALDLVRADGHREPLVLRTDAASGVSVSRTRVEEHALLAAAFDAGVTVPEPLRLCTDDAVIGRPFFLMRRVNGTTHPVRLTRGDALEGADRDALVETLGAELVRIHAVPLDEAGLAFLRDESEEGAGGNDGVPVGSLQRAVARYRRLLDELGARRPVLDWTLDWLSSRTLEPHDPVLCHNDFRTGNLMIGEGGRVTGVLDWEFAAPGDPHEDIGWFCAPCWRFASPEREGGGLGSREAFYRGYERASGRVIDREAVPVWEIVATLRWAVIALQQGARFTSGTERTLELGLTGRMIAELEWDLLDMVCEVGGLGGDDDARDAPPEAPLDEPSSEALLDVARTVLLQELLPLLPEERRYDGLMVAKVMGMAHRELDRAKRGTEGRRRDVAGADDEHASPVGREFVTRLRHDVASRLAIANPKRAEHAVASPPNAMPATADGSPDPPESGDREGSS